MMRQVIAATGTLIALAALPLAAPAGAVGQENGETVLALNGTLRCLLSQDDVPRGGGPMALCQQSNGQPLGAALYSTGKEPIKLDVALIHGQGQFYWDRGGIAPGKDIVVGQGQTVHVNGWTIKDEGLRIRVSYDATGHGYQIITVDARGF